MKLFLNNNNKIINLEEIEKTYKTENYEELVNIVINLLEENKIIPVKSSGGNGKNPTLYKKYRILNKKEDKSDIKDEIYYKLSPKLSIEYYKNHLNKYEEHRKYILMLSDFLNNKEELLSETVSMNERSFQIWRREKFLQKEGGKTIVKNLGLELSYLNYYDTSEPLAYYSKSKEVPQKILILENKDTYYTMRRHLISGGKKILGEYISTLIYGGGKNINKAFKDYKISVEDYVSNGKNRILYFGDLDYEGIIIYESLFKLFSKEYNITPFVNGYKKMIDKAKEEEISLPKTKEGQNKHINEIFLREFDNNYRLQIEKILKDGFFIPQEIVNITDLKL
ncbi:Wadjet anti-phage system protein JetD domain-containing protein [Clostridium sp. BJN0001]|uniref:Wadjet anti-phage system protein JetD domain-containing protein n=1 Tax=Clostridium sp. BJN0001 TaxID=2930219 RepID=UPI001FD5B1CD|nr:Wadjet anti-phage system protein JetD domain-containing protein [Clostridium sp. BJN0001]